MKVECEKATLLYSMLEGRALVGDREREGYRRLFLARCGGGFQPGKEEL